MPDFARLAAIGRARPLIHCVSNIVTANDCANLALAVGASPMMAQAPEEMAEITAVSAASVLNTGTPSAEKFQSCLICCTEAEKRGTPVVLDPVAAGVTTLRRESAKQLLEELQFAVIRGNASEIKALTLGASAGSGVDVSAVDAVTEENLPQAVEMVQTLARRTGAAVALSGVMDIVADGTKAVIIRNGCATMARITGSGCMLAALTGAFCGASPEHPFAAAAAGCCGYPCWQAWMDLADLRAQIHDGCCVAVQVERRVRGQRDPVRVWMGLRGFDHDEARMVDLVQLNDPAADSDGSVSTTMALVDFMRYFTGRAIALRAKPRDMAANRPRRLRCELVPGKEEGVYFFEQHGEADPLPEDFSGWTAYALHDGVAHATTAHRDFHCMERTRDGGIRFPAAQMAEGGRCSVYAVDQTGTMRVAEVRLPKPKPAPDTARPASQAQAKPEK